MTATGQLASDPTEADPAIEQVLDAALAQFEDLGIRRSTVEDVARRAGIDRVTVYRRVGSKDDLVQAVIAREARRLIDHVTTAVADLPTLDERIATTFATAIEWVRTNALYQRVLGLEGDTLLPRLTTHAGPLLATGTEAAVALIEQAHRDGLIDSTAGAQATAETLVRVLHSFVLTPEAVLSLRTAEDHRAFARAQLAPLVRQSG
jgi:AcrR family transcriptional regulator